MSTLNSCGCGPTCACGCCDGVKATTPVSTANPPGLLALHYRAGTHHSFFESMIAGLTTSGDSQLLRLGTRSLEDPAIAFLDGWAIVADILTFYQERIANEGYLRTAVQRRSVLELARLVGYRPRPGVAASAFLAYTIDPAFIGEAIIKAATRSTSVPAPGEQQQTFETSDELRARASWNLLRPRLTRPQTLESVDTAAGGAPGIYFQGTATNLKANDPILILPKDLYRVSTVSTDVLANRTLVSLIDWVKPKAVKSAVSQQVSVKDLAQDIALFKSGSVPPANAQKLGRSLDSISSDSESAYSLFDAFTAQSSVNLLQTVHNAAIAPEPDLAALTFRVKATLFASNLPGTPVTTITQRPANVEGANQTPGQDVVTTYTPPTFNNTAGGLNPSTDLIQTLALDAEYNLIKFGDWIVVDYPAPSTADPSIRKIYI
ncbi:MAG: hypothetical protein ABI806_05860, partial [Candidatus Solibacter sp.]